MSVLPGMKAPPVAGVSWLNGWKDISIDDYTSKNNWVLLFFYPIDFGYISPSEIMELEKVRLELKSLNCKIIAISTDSAVTHEKFCSIAPEFGGVKGIKFPLMEDVNGVIGEQYGVMKKDSGYTFRSYFIIDDKGIVRCRVVGDLPVGLGISEIPKKLRGLQNAVKEDAWYQVE